MANLRILWDPPLLTDIVDSISIYRAPGTVADCETIISNGTLVASGLPVTQTSYDDLGTPPLSSVTYGVYSVNSAGLSLCAYSSVTLAPNAAQSPTGLGSRAYDFTSTNEAPSGLSAADYTIDGIVNAAPTTLNVAVDLDPKYGIDMGNYVYPLYTTTEEAAFHDIKSGGSGSYNSVTYGDDIYYMPGQGGTTVGTAVPQAFTFNGITFGYDVISTGVEAEKLDETDEGPSSLTAAIQP